MALLGMKVNGVEGAFVPLELIERTKASIREAQANTDVYLRALGEQDERLHALRDTQLYLEARIANQRRALAEKEEALSRAKQDTAVTSRALSRFIKAATDEEWQAIMGRIFALNDAETLRTQEQEAEQARVKEKAALADQVLGSFGYEDDECGCSACRRTFYGTGIKVLL